MWKSFHATNSCNDDVYDAHGWTRSWCYVNSPPSPLGMGASFRSLEQVVPASPRCLPDRRQETPRPTREPAPENRSTVHCGVMTPAERTVTDISLFGRRGI